MVTGRLPDHIVLAAKDQLRSVRYSMRRGIRESRRLAAARDTFGLFEPVASVADAVIDGVEAATSALLADPRRSALRSAFPMRVEAFFDRSRSESENAYFFTEVAYGALKGLLRGFGAEAYVISGLAIEEAWAVLQARHKDHILAVVDPGGSLSGSSREENIRRLCAAISVTLAEQRPIKKSALDADDARKPRHLQVSPNSYCCWTIGLSTAVISLADEVGEIDKQQITAAADAAVDARFSRLMSAARSRDPIDALSKEFAAVLPFLP